MKSLITLFQEVLDELGGFCSVDTTRDSIAVARRFDNEGLQFLAVTLPSLGKGLERGLANGMASPDLFPGFRCRQNTPIFLGGFFDLVFDRTSGSVLDIPSIEAIRSLRQITLMFKKIELPSAPADEQAAFDKYVKCDTEVGDWEDSISNDALIEFHQLGSLLFSSVFRRVDLETRDYLLEPMHGSGATAEKLMGNFKFTQPEWTQRLEAVFPYWMYSTTRGYSTEKYDSVNFREPGDERPIRVVSVPKTLDAPRVIGIEPACMQYAQQGVRKSLEKAVKKSFLDNLIGTSSQEPNQLLALQGSIDGSLATLDLREASDRVSNLLVMTLTSGFPHLHDAVQASRSRSADVPGHGIIPLNRFASMGSALCFPFESMVFLTVVLLGIQDANGARFSSLGQIARWLGRCVSSVTTLSSP